MKYSDSFLDAIKSGAEALRTSAHNVTHDIEISGYPPEVREILISQIEANHQKADIIEGFIKRQEGGAE
jgi:hypothetical protein